MRLSFLAAAALYLPTLAAHANSIDFNSVSNGTYTYDLNVSSTETFGSGSSLTFSGLSGVTAASSQNGDRFIVNFTATTVTFTETGYFGPIYLVPGDYSQYFSITSTSGALGQASYATLGASPNLSGMVSGPVAAVATTPEPSSVALLGTGMLGLFGVARRKFAR